MSTDIREHVRETYAQAARATTDAEGCGCDCGCGCSEPTETTVLFGQGLYGPGERDETSRVRRPREPRLREPGRGRRAAPGETVLDLGSGGGIDVLLSARRVGPTGTVYGLDMTDEMLALAQQNAQAAGATNVHFLKGYIEAIPLPAESVDVVISNCVVNLSPDKPTRARRDRARAPARRTARDLRHRRRGSALAPRIAPSAAASRVHRGGALRERVPRRSPAAGLVDVEVELTHEVADGMHGAIVRARKPT